MRVLIACEHSGVERDAFIALGHDAISCDLLPTERPGPHYQCDVFEVLGDGWDLMIGHPPCTYLSASGMHWTTRGLRDPALTDDAERFFLALMNANIPRIAIENPIGIMSTRFRKPEQIIQPHQFGHDASKATCLWIKGLPKLAATSHVQPRMVCCGLEIGDAVGIYGCPNCLGGKKALPRWSNQTDSGQNKLPPSKDRWKKRSLTYQGIADAMANQWGAA